LAPENKMDAAFEFRLRNKLKSSTQQTMFWTQITQTFGANKNIFAAVAASVLIIFTIAYFAVNFIKTGESNETAFVTDSEKTVNSQSNNNLTNVLDNSETTINNAIKIAWREMTTKAVGDHKNCAIKFKLRENPISLEDAAKKYGEYNRNLDKSVFASLQKVFGGKIKFLEAHSCIFDGKRFAHIVLRYENQIVSVLVTDATDPNGAISDAITSESNQNLNVARFKTLQHAVFVVSSLTETDNLQFARILSNDLRQLI
ncbi:MAG: hypothetical protein H7Z37_13945, partial [Pyrinomonadaceae bacterium]|nr:hypothetical protein [Pyrinomonadaceae bacterium]